MRIKNNRAQLSSLNDRLHRRDCRVAMHKRAGLACTVARKPYADSIIDQEDKPVSMNDKQGKGSPWDVFMHLLAVIALYVSIVCALTLLFQYVNLSLPDPADAGVD